MKNERKKKRKFTKKHKEEFKQVKIKSPARYWLGKKRSEITKQKIRKANKGKHYSSKTEFKKGFIPWNKGKKGVQKSKWKGKIIPYLKKYQYKEGKLHLYWKGGKSRPLHGGKKYIEWRTTIYERDNFTCVICEKVGGKLEAHHIKDWVKYPKLRYNINNGITFCEDCHYLYHKLLRSKI